MKKIFKLLIFFLAINPLTSFAAIDFEHGNFTAENVKIEQKLGAVEQFKPATLINFKTGYRVAVYSDLQAQRYFSLGYELDKGLLGFSVVTNYSTTLSNSITATLTTSPVGTTKDKKGEQLATSTLGMKIYLNIEPGGNKEELVVCTGISGDSWTGCTRGLAFSGTSEAAVSAYQFAHSAGSKVVMSNIHYVYQNFVDIDSNQTIGGEKIFTDTATFQGGVSHFSSIPTTSTTTPTLDEQIATKKYVDQSVISGGVVGTEDTPGIWMGANKSEMSNGTATNTYSGIDYNLVLQSKNASSTSSATSTIVVTKTNGKIDTSFVDQTANYTWSGTTTFLGVTLGILESYIFGDGSDGDVIISTTTTLTKDTYYNNLTVNASTTLITGGYRIFVKGTLTNNGTIHNNGSNGASGSSCGTSGCNAGGTSLSGTLLGGGSGGGGSSGSGGGGGGGGYVFISAYNLINNGTISANGGNGGSSSGNTTGSALQGSGGTNISNGKGGNGGNAHSNTGGVVTESKIYLKDFFLALTNYDVSSASKSVGGGAGGAGARIEASTQGNPGGGGGGGLVNIFYKNAVFNIETATKGLAGSGSGIPASDGSNGFVLKTKIN